MKRDRLKPYIYKVEGPVNFAFYDMINGKFYHITPDGSVAELRRILLEKGLIFETDGVVPHKVVRYNLASIQDSVRLRNLQIRLNGRGEDNCWNRRKKSGDKKSLSLETLEQLIDQCRYIPIRKIQVEAENDEPEKVEKVITGFRFDILELNIENHMEKTQIERYEAICREKEIQLLRGTRKNMKNLKVELFNFFYSKYYNPCLGHQASVDTGGEIKHCLWLENVLGYIKDNHLKDMIHKGVFDELWGMSKDCVKSCKDCELRYACDDCRVSVLSNGGSKDSKPGFCSYNPYHGD